MPVKLYIPTSERYLSITWPQYPLATTSLAWILTKSLSPHLQGLLLHGSSWWLYPQSSRHLQGLLQKTAVRWCPPSDWCKSLLWLIPFFPSLSTLSPTVPASVPGCWHTQGPASAGSRASNWKGELQSTKAYQLAVRERSATSGASPRSKVGWQPFVW